MKFKLWTGFALLAGIASGLIVSACGGSSSAKTSVTNEIINSGTNIWVTANSSYQDVHLSFTRVLLNTSATAGPDDSGWVGYSFATPVTVDFNQSNNGTLFTLLHNIQIPVNSYQQMRLVLEETGSSSAPNNYVIDSTGTTYPLQIADPSHGWTLRGSFNVTAVNILNPPPTINPVSLQVALSFNFDADLVPPATNTPQEYLLKPRLSYINLTQAGTSPSQVKNAPAGVITGSVSGAPTGTTVTAEMLSSDGSYHQSVLSTQVKSDGSFTLYPLPLSSTSKGRTFDIVIHGEGIQTQIIRSVPVNPTLAPVDLTEVAYPPSIKATVVTSTVSCPASGACTYLPTSNAVTLNQTAIALTTASTSYTANLQTAMAAGTRGAWVDFYQTLPAKGEVPYEITYRHINPYTGLISAPTLLGTGDVLVSTYVASSNPTTASSETPAEGSNSYTVVAEGPGFARLAATSTLSAPASGTSATVSIGALSVASGYNSRSILNGTVDPQVTSTLDTDWALAVSDGQIVAAQQITPPSGALGSYSYTGLPSNTTSYFGIYIEAWDSSDLTETGQGYGELVGDGQQSAAANLSSGNADALGNDPLPPTLYLP